MRFFIAVAMIAISGQAFAQVVFGLAPRQIDNNQPAPKMYQPVEPMTETQNAAFQAMIAQQERDAQKRRLDSLEQRLSQIEMERAVESLYPR